MPDRYIREIEAAMTRAFEDAEVHGHGFVRVSRDGEGFMVNPVDPRRVALKYPSGATPCFSGADDGES